MDSGKESGGRVLRSKEMTDRLSLDDHKLLHHLKPLVKWLNGERIFPIYAAVSLTRLCNYRCIFCVYDTIERSAIHIPSNPLIRIIDELRRDGLKAVFLSGEGEPLLHPEVCEIIAQIRNFGTDVALNTNGFRLSRETSMTVLKHLTFVRVSLNGWGNDDYEFIHRSPKHAYDTVLSNLADAVIVKKENGLDVTIGVQCILLEENIDHLIDLTKDLKAVGVDYLVFKPFLPIEGTIYRTKLDLYSKNTGAVLKACEEIGDDRFHVITRWHSFKKIQERTYDVCMSLPFMVEIDCKGDVYPCGVLLGKSEFSFGNIIRQSYQSLMDSERYRDVTRKIQHELDVHKCMPNCRNDAVNRFLWKLRHPSKHVNFI